LADAMFWFSLQKIQAVDNALTVELHWTQTQLCVKSSKQEISVAWNATYHTCGHHTLCKSAKVKIPLRPQSKNIQTFA